MRAAIIATSGLATLTREEWKGPSDRAVKWVTRVEWVVRHPDLPAYYVGMHIRDPHHHETKKAALRDFESVCRTYEPKTKEKRS